MNISSLFGVLFGVGVMYFALVSTTDNMGFFLDMHGILIVMGGTAAASSISFPLTKLFSLFKVFMMRVLGRNKVDYQGTIAQILDLQKKAAGGVTGLRESVESIKHPFLKEAVGLVASGVMSEREIRDALDQRLKTVETVYMQEANMFRIIGRYPPAFGLLATTLGMIAVLQKLGEPDAQKLLGPAMSIGLIGTLYGIALANMVFNPIAENLTERTREEVALRRIIVEGTVLLKSQVNPMALREALNSHLLPKHRVVRSDKKKAA